MMAAGDAPFVDSLARSGLAGEKLDVELYKGEKVLDSYEGS